MDPLHLSIALGPLSIYFIGLGLMNLSSRPLMVSGTRDAGVLGLAVSGFMVSGPMELFMPESAAASFGWYIWPLLLALYGLCLMLVLLTLRPRIMIYNITTERLRPLLEDLATRLDGDSAWAGDSLTLPNLSVHLHVETSMTMRNAQLAAVGWRQSHQGWQQLRAALKAALAEVKIASNPRGFSLVTVGLLMVGLVAFWMVTERQTLVQALYQMLRM